MNSAFKPARRNSAGARNEHWAPPMAAEILPFEVPSPTTRFDQAATRAMSKYKPEEWMLLTEKLRAAAIYAELRNLDAESIHSRSQVAAGRL